MTLLRRVTTTTGGRTLLVLLLAFAVFNGYTALAAPGKIDDAIDQAVDARGQVDVQVTFSFEPERYHILELQDYGRVSGATDTSLQLRGTTPAQVRELARTYWVERIDLLEQETWSP